METGTGLWDRAARPASPTANRARLRLTAPPAMTGTTSTAIIAVHARLGALRVLPTLEPPAPATPAAQDTTNTPPFLPSVPPVILDVRPAPVRASLVVPLARVGTRWLVASAI